MIWTNIYEFINNKKLSILWTIIILILSFIKLPQNSGPDLIPYADKLVHFGLYFILGILLKKEKTNTTKALIFIILLGGGIEILQQTITTYRSGEWIDFFADITGSLLGLYHKNIINLFQ